MPDCVSSSTALSGKKRKEPDYDSKMSDENKELKKKLLESEMKLAESEKLVESLKAKLKSMEEKGGDDEESGDDEDSVAEEDSNDPWNIRYQELREYRLIHGDCKVPMKVPKLGVWVNNQKLQFSNLKKGKSGGKIKPERILKLDSIGMFWGAVYPAPEPWEARFEELKKYQKAMGNCNVDVNPTDPSPLAKWVSFQRTEYKRFRKGQDSLLSLEQIGQLKEIGFKFKGPRLF